MKLSGYTMLLIFLSVAASIFIWTAELVSAQTLTCPEKIASLNGLDPDHSVLESFM